MLSCFVCVRLRPEAEMSYSRFWYSKSCWLYTEKFCSIAVTFCIKFHFIRRRHLLHISYSRVGLLFPESSPFVYFTYVWEENNKKSWLKKQHLSNYLSDPESFIISHISPCRYTPNSPFYLIINTIIIIIIRVYAMPFYTAHSFDDNNNNEKDTHET